MKRVSLLFLILFLSSCAALQKSNLVQKPSVTDWKVKLTNITFDDVQLEYRMKLSNPNPVGIKVKNYSYAVSVEQNELTSGKQDKETELKANDSMWVSIPLKFTYSELAQLGKAFVKSDSLSLGFKSNFGIDLPVLGLMQVPFETSYSVPMLKRPNVSISSFKIDQIGFLGAKFVLKINVDNPNSMKIDLGKIGINFKVNGKSWINTALEQTGALPAKAIKELSIPISVSFADVGMSLFNSIRNSEPFQYALEGNVAVKLPLFDSEMFTIPINKSGELKIN